MKLQTFVFKKSEVRTVIKNNEPWFVGKDISEILGYSNSSDALGRHVDSEDKADVVIHDGRQNRNMNAVNESGMYALIFGSKLSQAKDFKRWVTSEVLPSIRQHGAYMNAETIERALTDPDTIIQLATTLKKEREERMLLEQQIAEYEPKLSYLDTILSSKDTVTISQIAADYGMSAIAMNRLLNELGMQRKVSGQWILYRKHQKQGYTKSKTTKISLEDGSQKVVMNTRWTQKGRLAIYDMLKEEEILPEMDLELAEA